MHLAMLVLVTASRIFQLWPGNSRLQHVGSSLRPRLKPGPCIVSAESEPLDHQGSPQGDSFLMLSLAFFLPTPSSHPLLFRFVGIHF